MLVSADPPKSSPKTQLPKKSLDKGQLGGSDVKSVDIRGQTGVSLLGAIRTDEGVDLDGVNVVELLEGSLDLGLVGLDVDDEDKSVVLLDLLHGALSVERVDDDLVLIEAGLVVDRLALVLGVARQRQGLGAVEGRGGPDLVALVGVNTLKSSLGRVLGLLGASLALGSTCG